MAKAGSRGPASAARITGPHRSTFLLRLFFGRSESKPVARCPSNRAAGEHAGQHRQASLDAAPHSGPRDADGLRNVRNAARRAPAVAQAGRDPEIAPRPG
ncbi:MAG: hypothetical protein ACLQFI_15520 [Methylocella sp.]